MSTYNANQPRVPSGSSDGGQWASEGGSTGGTASRGDYGGGAKLGKSATTEGGVKFETGKKVTFKSMRNPERAPKAGPMDQFQQKVEPAGRYMLHDAHGTAPASWNRSEVTFKNPLVIEFNTKGGTYDQNSWKVRLSEAFGGKTGRALSAALRRAGHDGIVTTDKYGTSEIVAL